MTKEVFFEDVSEQTRKVMKGNRGKGTRPEVILRRILRGMGYRYRLNHKDLPGSPDIAFVGRKRAIFLHGCFWHAHDDPTCKLARRPKTRKDFWEKKFERNRARDARSEAALRAMGWQVMVVWECRLQSVDDLKGELSQFLESEDAQKSIG